MVRYGIRTTVLLSLLLAALLAATGSAPPASAASTITVSTCDESSLTQAINNAAAGDTIVFGCSGTITFAGYSIFQYTISKNLTIDGSGQNVILSGNRQGGDDYTPPNGSSIFLVTSGVTLTLNGLTITNGVGGTFSSCDTCDHTDSGGAITVEQGTVNISNSTFTNNISTGLVGGGVILSTLGTVTVDNSTFSGNTAWDSGGAIQSLISTLTVTNSTFSGNLTRVNGGGIDTVSGTATISNSTFTNNTANAWSGAGSGAGVANTGDMTITNSTFSGNQAEAGGAIANQVGTLNVIDSTLVGNHANWWANGILSGTRDGIYLASSGGTTTTLKNTILANGPTRSGSADAFTFGGNCVTNGTLNDGGGNYSDDETCGASHVSTADLKLGSLANNGGPTQTIALSSGSVAINAVACISTINTDQRGYTRATTGSTCDAGAYEFGAINPIKTTTLSAVSGSGSYGGTATLTAKLATSGTGVSGKSIAFKLNGTSVGSATTNISGVATLPGVSLSGINAGSHSGAIAASFAGDSGYTSSSGSGDLSVSLADQTISFDLSSLPTKGLGDPPFDISSYASINSDLTISFASTTTAVCSVSGSMVTINTLGMCTITASQIGDANHNPATSVSQSFDIADLTPPVTSATAVQADSTAYTFGLWTKQAVTVTLSASDTGGSGLDSTFYTVDSGGQQTYSVPFTISSEGSHTLTFWSIDHASNEETPHKTAAINIDNTAPSISGTATTSPNGNGWYKGSVTIHWTCSDALSGIDICPSDQTISAEGVNQTISGTAIDMAGNSTTVDSSPAVNIDLTAPSISGAATTDPNGNGWYKGSVTIHWTCSDALSGIATCPSDQTISSEGASQTVQGTATDLAGNSTTVDSPAVNIDLTAPTISGAATISPNGNGWYNGSVTIHWTCTDPLSGIASCPSDQTITTEGANQTVSGTATDLAGNSTTVDSSPAVNIDLTAPTISGAATTSPNANGWYNTSVTIHWTCSDALSGIATCPSDQTISTEGASQTVSGTAIDMAGNSTTVDSPAVNIDLTAPTNVVGTPERAPDSNGWYNHAVTVNFSGSDAISGIDSCSSLTYSGPDGGAVTVDGSCTDLAGNSTDSSATFAYDATAPTVTYAGNAGSYTALQTVTITCTAVDALSGIATTTCQNISGLAYTLGAGTVTISSTATDVAGNVGHGSVTFTVTASANDLTTLTEQFETNRTIARQLAAPLGGIQLATMMHNAKLKAGFVNTYILLVNAQRGRTLTNQQADTLIALANTL